GGDVSPGRGWVMVWSTSLEADHLVETMQKGEFHASTGVVLKTINYDRGSRTHVVEITELEGVSYETKFIGTRRTTPEITGEVFATVSGNRAEYELTGDELYIRAVVTSSRSHANPSYEGQREQAWTQPVGWRHFLETK
ncbi:unnamed protein product, partial [marine sediment metagenome]